MASLVLPMCWVWGMPRPVGPGGALVGAGDVLVASVKERRVQSPPLSVTAMRAAFSSTMALFRANAAVRALMARLFTARG